MNHALVRQVYSLGDLVDGWFDEGFEPYSSTALEWLARLLDGLVAGFKIPIPYVYPTAVGLVRAGWVTPRWDVIADIDLATHKVAVAAWKATTSEVHERQIELELPGADAVLGRFVAGHTR